MILNTDLDLKLKFRILKIKLFGWIDTLEIRRKLGENMRLLAAAPAPKKCIDRPLSAKKKEKNSLRGKQSFLLCQFFLLSLYSLALVCVPVLQGHEGCLSRLLLLLVGHP